MNDLKNHQSQIQQTIKSVLHKTAGLEKIASNSSISMKTDQSFDKNVSNQNVLIEIKKLKMTVTYLTVREEQTTERINVLTLMGQNENEELKKESNPFLKNAQNQGITVLKEHSKESLNPFIDDLFDKGSEDSNSEENNNHPHTPLLTGALDIDEFETASEEEEAEIPQLPLNLIQRILEFLAPKELCLSSMVSKDWNKIWYFNSFLILFVLFIYLFFAVLINVYGKRCALFISLRFWRLSSTTIIQTGKKFASLHSTSHLTTKVLLFSPISSKQSPKQKEVNWSNLYKNFIQNILTLSKEFQPMKAPKIFCFTFLKISACQNREILKS